MAGTRAAVRSPIEKKVTAGAVVAYLVSLAGLAIVNAVTGDASLLGPLPDWLETILVPIVPALGSLLAGYNAHHTPRPDLAVSSPPPPGPPMAG